jgi:hypothetical protein
MFFQLIVSVALLLISISLFLIAQVLKKNGGTQQADGISHP